MTVDELRARYPFLRGMSDDTLATAARTTQGESRIFVTTDSLILYLSVMAAFGAAIDVIDDVRGQRCLCDGCRKFLVDAACNLQAREAAMQEFVDRNGRVHLPDTLRPPTTRPRHTGPSTPGNGVN